MLRKRSVTMPRTIQRPVQQTSANPPVAVLETDPEEAPATGSSQGDAGASAQREFERRRDKRAQRIREKHPRLGGLILILSEEPQSTTAWEKGAKGEREVGEKLEKLVASGLEILHDRRIPGTRANIDHLAVSTAGVFVIDPKRYRGKVEKRDVGGFFKKDERLFVANRDRSKLVDGAIWQLATVRNVIGEAIPGLIPEVKALLCFVDAEWALFQRPLQFGEITVLWPKELIKVLERPGVLSREQVKELAGFLAQKFPAA
jgi:hypothetical protein